MVKLYRAVLRDSEDETVRECAVIAVRHCPEKDWRCELDAIWQLMTVGNSDVPGFEHGVRYVADQRHIDHWTAPRKLVELCKRGACAEDCESQGMMVAALLASIGFKVGLRIFKPDGSRVFNHLYPVVMVPKDQPTEWVGFDTSATDQGAHVGWEPAGGFHRTISTEG